MKITNNTLARDISNNFCWSWVIVTTHDNQEIKCYLADVDDSFDESDDIRLLVNFEGTDEYATKAIPLEEISNISAVSD